MSQLNKAAFEAANNDASTGRYKSGQVDGIGSDDHRAMITDLADSVLFIEDHLLDEDDMSSNSATQVPSQQSVKAYVDGKISGLLSTKVTIPSAEVLALNTTPKQLVAAQGANTIILPIKITFWLNYGTTPYATNVNLNYQYGALASPDLVAAFNGAVTIDQSTGYIQTRSLEINTLDSNLINKIFGLSVNSGDPTAGDSDLIVDLTYRVITL